jgi:hypothetical protein
VAFASEGTPWPPHSGCRAGGTARCKQQGTAAARGRGASSARCCARDGEGARRACTRAARSGDSGDRLLKWLISNELPGFVGFVTLCPPPASSDAHLSPQHLDGRTCKCAITDPKAPVAHASHSCPVDTVDWCIPQRCTRDRQPHRSTTSADIATALTHVCATLDLRRTLTDRDMPHPAKQAPPAPRQVRALCHSWLSSACLQFVGALGRRSLVQSQAPRVATRQPPRKVRRPHTSLRSSTAVSIVGP